MNFAEFGAVFDRFRATAFRLQTLPRSASDFPLLGDLRPLYHYGAPEQPRTGR